jgi:hypothetical protein
LARFFIWLCIPRDLHACGPFYKFELVFCMMQPFAVSDHKNLTTFKVANRDGEDSSVSDSCQKIEKTISIDTIQNSISPKDVKCHVVYETVNEKLGVDHKSTVNAGEDVAKSCCQVEDKERHCLSTSCINTETSQEHYVGAMLEVTENCSNEVKVTVDVGLNNNSDEKSAPSAEENIPVDSQIEFRTRGSKYSAESNHDSPKISDSFELRFKTNCAQPGDLAESVNGCGSRLDGDSATGEAGLKTNILMHVESENTSKDLPANCEDNSSAVSAPNADEAEPYYSKTIDLQTNKNSGGCQSILVSSDICEKIEDGVNEVNKASREADADFFPADVEVILDDKPGSHSRPNGHTASGEAGLTTNTLMDLESQNITKDLPVNCENNSSVVGAPRIDLQTNKNPGDCESISVSSGVCEKIADGVNERNKTSNADDVLPVDIEVFPNNKPGIKMSSELAELDLQVDQTDLSNANIGSGAAMHCISTNSTSRGSTVGTVPANQGS